MSREKDASEKLIESLKERAKELNCLYQIEQVLGNHTFTVNDVCTKIVKIIPFGWRYPEICQAKITIGNEVCYSPNFTESAVSCNEDIIISGKIVGNITVQYKKPGKDIEKEPFLKEEIELLKTIANRLGCFVENQNLRQEVREHEESTLDITRTRDIKWQKVLELLKESDRELYYNITRKMINHLCWSGATEVEKFLLSPGNKSNESQEELREDWNIPHQRRKIELTDESSTLAFKIASENLSDEKIQNLIQKWLQEDKLSYLDKVINRNHSLTELASAIRRYYPISPEEPNIPSASKKGIKVSLIRRFLSDQLQFINVAKNFINVVDIYNLLEHVIYCYDSHGKLGGKSAGMYLAAQILKTRGKDLELLKNVKIPKTWHITSDGLIHFVRTNSFDDIVEQKYKELDEIYLEYPYIVQSFKCGRFPADIINGLTTALDDFGENPIIVRSSSLLEDRVGAAFSGKYRSLFLANQGTKHERLDALVDAISEVYASTFCPDAIEYRAERGLLDFVEEMGIMIQEVVGTRVGKYFLPAFAGVAFSYNEFRWSPRIKREDGLVRLVPGLGTRAVDRLSNDYPVLIAPGQPGLRVNVSTDEIIRYSPKMIDVLNLESNAFETLEIKDFFAEVGYKMPGLSNIVSVLSEDGLIRSVGFDTDLTKENLIVNFEGLISRTTFIKQMQYIMKILEEELNMPVDIEFGSDGTNLYLLQCRSQSSSDECHPAKIPSDIPPDKTIFTANRYVSNGGVPEITHIVFIDCQKYEQLTNRNDMQAIGRVVGKLNKLLPKRKFILIGPGRWGSRGDIKLGVNVGYSDINNTAMLIEVAYQKGDYVPDLSFGTHFFQDLVEANIRYLPIYPDNKNVIFNEVFLKTSPNSLGEFLPEASSLSEVIRVIDVPKCTDGQILKVLMNADIDRALGMLSPPE